MLTVLTFRALLFQVLEFRVLETRVPSPEARVPIKFARRANSSFNLP
jgi:hypothetical protein